MKSLTYSTPPAFRAGIDISGKSDPRAIGATQSMNGREPMGKELTEGNTSIERAEEQIPTWSQDVYRTKWIDVRHLAAIEVGILLWSSSGRNPAQGRHRHFGNLGLDPAPIAQAASLPWNS